MQLRLTKHLALQPLIDSQTGLASRTTTCELRPEAVLICLYAPLEHCDCESNVESPIDALNSNSSFQLPTSCLAASSVCSNLCQQLLPGANSSLSHGRNCEHVAVTLTDLPGGFFGSLATKCSRRRLIEVHLPLSQQGWLHRSQLVPWLSKRSITRRRTQMAEASQGFHVKAANTGPIRTCIQAGGSKYVYAKRARSLHAWGLHGSRARK
jgi:hypothetical protein